MEGGYYADVEAECQVFHICGNDGNGGLTKYSFLCPNGTIFQQQYFVCDWWFNVDCSLAEDLYSLNDQYAAEREANSGAGGAFGERINVENEGKDGEVREEGSSRGFEGSPKDQAEYDGNSEVGTPARVRSSRKKARRGRKNRHSQRQRGKNRNRTARNEEESLSSYGSNNAGTANGLGGGYEAIGSPGFGGQGAFGPDGLFSADYPALPGYGSEGSSGLGNYNRNARDILDNYFDDYINLQDYSL